MTPAGVRQLVTRRPSGAGRAGRRARGAASPTRQYAAGRRDDRSRRRRRLGRRRWSSRSRSRSPAEYGFFREGLILYTYLHLAAEPALTRELVQAKVRGRRLRDDRDGRRAAAAAAADERGGGAHGGAGGRHLPREGARRQGRAAGRRAGHPPRARRHPRRRRRRAQRGHHRDRHGRPGDRARRPRQDDGLPRGRLRQLDRDAVLEPLQRRGDGPARGPGGRGGADPRSAGARSWSPRR